MRTQRSYYEILGLPRTATTEQIKRRYRELARKYHPDVMKDKALGQRAFVQITEAYKTLVDPDKRAAYDLTLPSPDSTSGTRFDNAGATRTAAGSERTTSTGHGHVSSPRVTELIREAQFSFVKRRFNEAADFCRQALKIERTSARAHAILGDIYYAQHKIGQAITEYSYAVQYDPGDRETQGKLDRLTRREQVSRHRPRPSQETPRRAFPDKRVAAINAIGWPAVFGILMLMSALPQKPISALQYYLPLVDKWSWNLVIALGLSSGLASALMMVSGLLENPDEELIFEDSGILPIGVPLLLFSVILFWGAAALYLLLGVIQGSLSKSVVKVFAAVAAIVLFAGFLYPMGSDQVWLFGGNVAFIGALAGWYAAAMVRPLSG